MKITDCLCDGWLFKKTDELTFTIPSDDSWENVTIPHTYNAFDGQDGGNDYYKGKAVYIRKIKRPDVPEDYKIYLSFDAVNSVARVFADGEPVIEHRGGYSRFRADITRFFERKKEIVLTVEADNTNISDVYPQMADFTFYGGIYRTVSMIALPNTHFDIEYYAGDGVTLSSKIIGTSAILNIDAYIKEPDISDMVFVEVKNDKLEAVGAAAAPAKATTSIALKIDDVHLWQGTDDPYLYNVSIKLIRHNEVLDEISLSHGIREFYVDPDKGFFLNGKSTPLRGVSRHQDILGKGNALKYEDHYNDAELIKEVGANTVRLAHYQHDAGFYEICDNKGFVVWAEIPFISRMNKDAKAHDNAMEQMRELIYQNYNHTSICFWGISNEITIAGDIEGLLENLKELNALVKSIDKSRLTTMAQVSMLPMESEHNLITDVLSYNLYFGWYSGKYTDNEKWLDKFRQMHPGRALGLSEYGCEGIISWHSKTPECKDYTEEYQAEYHEHMAKILSERDYIWASHVWNMFDFGCDARDEGGVRGRNNKGLVTFDRKIKKDSFYVYKAYWSKEKFVHIAGKRFAVRSDGEIDIKLYSNMPQVKLFVNDTDLGVQSGDKVFVFENVSLNAGVNYVRAVGIEDDINAFDATCFVREDEPFEGYVMPDEDDDVGVKNWFEDVDMEDINADSLTFNAEYFSIRDTVEEVIRHPEAGDILVAMLNTFGAMKVKKSMLGIMGVMQVEDMGSLMGADSESNRSKFALLNRKLQEIRK